MGLKIGLMGIDFQSGNKGVSALAYSALKIMEEIRKQSNISVDYCLMIKNLNEQEESLLLSLQKYLHISPSRIKLVKYNIKNLASMKIYKRAIQTCDIVIDYTEGDSFTDLYGMKRFIMHYLLKSICVRNCSCNIMGPQTYGPFQKKICGVLAGNVLQKYSYVFSRDKKSTEILKRINVRLDIKAFTDIAFALPYQKREIRRKQNKLHIGFNVSGLLWNGGYHGDNQFGLILDYKEYVERVVSILAADNRYVVHMISHVITSDKESIEDDYNVCRYLHGKYPNTVLAEAYSNPIDLKSYISGLDILIGARMHATVAAASSKVAVIPIAYSMKFSGLYYNLNYHNVIDGRNVNTEEAIKLTLDYIDKKDVLERETIALCGNAQRYLMAYKAEICNIMRDMQKQSEN